MQMGCDDLSTCPYFNSIPGIGNIKFIGIAGDGVFLYDAEHEGEEIKLLTTSVIAKEEKFVWESFRDLISHSVEQAGELVRGVYKLDLLSFDIQGEIRTFSEQELTSLITNHARKLQVGEECLVKYSSCFWLIKKMVIEDWGKITLNCSVQDYNHPAEKMDLLVSRMLKLAEKVSVPAFISVIDHSRNVILDDKNDEQKRRLKKTLDKTDSLFSPRREVFWSDHIRTTELNRYVSG